MSYGLPYMGSKNAIAKYIVDQLPAGARLVDLFCGGCAVTDYAMKKTEKYGSFLINDLNTMVTETYLKALAGGFRDEDRWIGREEYFRILDTDPYAFFCFTFGVRQDGCSYAYSKELEPYKRALHYIIFWNNYGPMEELCPAVCPKIHEFIDSETDRRQRRIKSGKAVVEHVKEVGDPEYAKSNAMFRAIKKRSNLLESLERLERLQNLECLQSLEALERLQSLEHQAPAIEASNIDYRQYEHRAGDVVYCDPPYVCEYVNYRIVGKFDTPAFWEWVRTRDYPVYVSEYSAPEDFVSIWHREKKCSMNDKKVKSTVEHLFLHRRFTA